MKSYNNQKVVLSNQAMGNSIKFYSSGQLIHQPPFRYSSTGKKKKEKNKREREKKKEVNVIQYVP